MKKKEQLKERNIPARLLFLLYCAGMLWLLFGQRMGTGFDETNVNWIPLETVKLYLHLTQSSNPYFVRIAYINLVGNVVLFIPIGIFLPCIWKKMRLVFITAAVAVVAVCMVEILQYLTGLGSCDIDDLILNTVGVVLGYGAWRIYARFSGRQ